ncbi:hypothetical protein [Streptantibioticus silvisoli]|uniref:Uncharacterized protein n=1 Tax=Streptantibioticus silvisoli TaxID=2705255 RepID=A0ABT6W4S0_9ACTN|nr:hypothetical protein [Streptantibioticus silvisoli]MDI5965752.1 hypothetical protein [Streptantibioticus silvisoli]
MFGRSSSPEQQAAKQELKAAKQALAADPVNTGELGTVDINSVAGQANLAAQDRVHAAEENLRRR